MTLEEICKEDGDFLKELRDGAFHLQQDFYQTSEYNTFCLSHTHSTIYRICKHLSGIQEMVNYGEIGSHIGNSALVAGWAGDNIQISCYDSPNSGWGGEPNTSQQLEKVLGATFPVERYRIHYGNSHDKSTKKMISLRGPYDIFLVDGDHSSGGAMADLEAVYPLIRLGGYIIFDDTLHHEELKGVFQQFLNKHAHQESLLIDTLTPTEEANGYVIRGVGIMKR